MTLCSTVSKPKTFGRFQPESPRPETISHDSSNVLMDADLKLSRWAVQEVHICLSVKQ